MGNLGPFGFYGTLKHGNGDWFLHLLGQPSRDSNTANTFIITKKLVLFKESYSSLLTMEIPLICCALLMESLNLLGYFGL